MDSRNRKLMDRLLAHEDRLLAHEDRLLALEDRLLSRGNDLADTFERQQEAIADRILSSAVITPVQASGLHFQSPPSRGKTRPRFQRNVKPLPVPEEYKRSLVPGNEDELIEKLTALQKQLCQKTSLVDSDLHSSISRVLKKTNVAYLYLPQEIKKRRETLPLHKILNVLAADNEKW